LTYTVFPVPPPVVIPVNGIVEMFPVRRIYCVGRNYAAHAVEMGHDPQREAPFFFQKNRENIVLPGSPFPYPSLSSNVHHEVECYIALQNGGSDIPEESALETVFGYGVSVDFTRRDLQSEAKTKGRPWEMAKAFESSAPVSAITRSLDIGHPHSGRIELLRNGKAVQVGDINQMIWKTQEIIAALSRFVALDAGDLILTGTPAGVGPVERDDHIECRIAGIGELSFDVI